MLMVLRGPRTGAASSLFVLSALLAGACAQAGTSSSQPQTGSGGRAAVTQGGSQSAGSQNVSGTTSGGRLGAGGQITSAAGGGTPIAGSGSGGAAGGASGAGASSGGASGANTAGGTTTEMDNCAPAPVGAITFSVPSGTFQGALSVELSTSAAGAEIRYTTDHTPPTPSSTLYSGPIALSATTELMAQAFAQGVALGQPEVAIYVSRAFDQMHDLPVIVLDSYGTALPNPTTTGGGPGGAVTPTTNAYVNAALLSFEPIAGMTSLSAAPKVATPAGFHIRGQSSASYDKKPYRVELHKVDGSDRNCPMLGMPRESDWVLHSPFPDKALIRNAFVYSLGRAIGMPAPRGAFAEVYVNTAGRPLASSDYMGVYLLVETIKNQKDRLNLQQLQPTDTALPALSGGYIFKFEWQVMDIEQKLTCPSGTQNCWNWLELDDPKPWVQAQQDYLSQYLASFVTALHSASPSDPSTGYPAFMDTTSFANQVIIHELTRNLDAYSRSQYFYKDRDAKMFAGPLWDYDLIAGVGSAQTYANLSQSGWQYESNASRLMVTADWFPRLLADPAFKAALVARWKALRQGELSDAQVTLRITTLTTGLANGAQRNFQKWNNLTTERIGFFTTPTAATWDGQVAAMHDWLIGRMAWLDSQWQ